MPLKPLPFIACLLACAAASAAEPQAELEPVLVTATLRPVPVSERAGGVTVLGAGDVREAAVVHLEELLPQVPSLSWAGASSRPRYFQLRGIGELEQYQGAPNPSVGFLVDEIDFSGIGMIASTFDVEQVEVLRGPQGTRYGANALGGLIKVKTRDARPVRELGTELTVGDDGLWSAGAVAGGGLAAGESLSGAWRAVLQRAVGDGFRDNRFLGRDDTNGRDETTARLKVRLAAEGRLARRPRAAARGLRQPLRRLRDRQQLRHAVGPARDATRSAPTALPSTSRSTLAGGAGAALDHGLRRVGHRRELRRRLGQRQRLGRRGPVRFLLGARCARAATRARTCACRARPGPATRGSRACGCSASRRTTTSPTTAATSTDAFVRRLDSRYRATSAALYGQADVARRAGDDARRGPARRGARRRYADSDGVAFDPRDRLWGGELSVLHRAGRAPQPLGDARARLPRGRIQHRHVRAGGSPAVRRGVPVVGRGGVEGRERGGRPARATSTSTTCAASTRRSSTSLQLDPEDPLTFMFLTDNAASGEAWGLESSAGARARRAASSSRRCCHWMESRFTAIASASATSTAAPSRMRRNGRRRSPPPGAIPRAGWRASTCRARPASTSTPATTSARTRASWRTSAPATRPSAGRSRSGCATCSTSAIRCAASISRTSRRTSRPGCTCAGATRARSGLTARYAF